MLNLETKQETIPALNEALAYIKGQPITTKEQMLPDKVIECTPMDEEWKALIKERQWWATEYDKDKLASYLPTYPRILDLLNFRDFLLTLGGEEACLDLREPDFENICQRGQVWYGDKVNRMRGDRSQCHANSVNLWEQNQDQLRIATGYALSDDGMWRQHTWLIYQRPRQNQVIETTEPRQLYFGFVMTFEECEEFASHY